ncbi:MAG: hypothetical protein AAF512_01030 [Pseudomonadota bacterium]
MKKPIKQSVKNYLGDFELNNEQLSALQLLDKKAQSQVSRQRYWLSGIAASLLCLILAAGGYYKYQQNNHLLIESIAREVITNHHKMKPLEVAGQRINEIAGYFDKLDFAPAHTALVHALQKDLIGGRYCSIQGETALQLRMRDGQNVFSTLFEARYDDSKFDVLPVIEAQEAPITVNLDGYRVKLWVEKGIVMALVEKG